MRFSLCHLNSMQTHRAMPTEKDSGTLFQFFFFSKTIPFMSLEESSSRVWVGIRTDLVHACMIK